MQNFGRLRVILGQPITIETLSLQSPPIIHRKQQKQMIDEIKRCILEEIIGDNYDPEDDAKLGSSTEVNRFKEYQREKVNSL